MPLDATPLAEQRNDARQYILQIERSQEAKPQQSPSIDPDSIPDELVEQMLSDADFRTTLDELHERMKLSELADLDAGG